MSEGNKLFKNTIVYAIGNFGSKILAFLLLPLYSFYLSTGEFGVYDIILTTVSFLVPIVTMQFSEASYRWLLDAGEDQKLRSAAISNGFVVILLNIAVFSLIYFIVSIFIDLSLTIYFPFILILSCLLPFFQQCARGMQQTKHYAAAGILNTFLVLSFNIIFLVVLKLKLESLLLALILSKLFTTIYLIFSTNIFRNFSFNIINWSTIKSMFGYSWPLVPNTISWWLINAADKYIILYVLSIEANGIYGVASRFPAIIVLVNSVFLMAWQDTGITTKETDYSKKDSFFAKTFHKFITFELTFVAVLICCSPYIVKYLIDPKFHDAWQYMGLLFLGVAFSSFAAYIGVVYLKTNRTKGIFNTTLVGGFVNILFSFLLIKHIGLYAPAVAGVVSFILVYSLRMHQAKSFSPIFVDNKHMVKLTIWCLICVSLVSLQNVYITVIIGVLSSLIFVKCNWTTIASILALLKESRTTRT